MKKLKKNNLVLLLATVLTIISPAVMAQNDSVAQKEIVKLHYYNLNNSLQYLLLECLLKKGKRIEPQQGKGFKIFLDQNRSENLVSEVVTNPEGKAKAILPPQLKNAWDSSTQHSFLVVNKEGETVSEFTFTKAKIVMDTSSVDSTKNISVVVMKLGRDGWVPVKDAEVKIGIQRMGGILSAGEGESYSTDSTGTVTTAFKREGMPGNARGDLLLVARIEDNDELGNLTIEKQVPWGVSTQTNNHFFDQRTLWSTRFKTPIWLLFMAYSLVIAVWGTIIYLVMQLVKIKKLAASSD